MDPTRFSGKDVIEMAVRIEENGLAFYTEAAIASESEEIKKLFQFLGDEEKRHIYCFENIGKSFKDDNLPGISDPYIEETSLYLGALANSRVFTEKDEGSRMAKKVRDEDDALRTAIDMEKDSILFYYELEKVVKEKDRSVLATLISEEKKHLAKLTELQKNLSEKTLPQ
ncbi:MAG: ferritin family protein [Deltaproteobacteria bacterium]|nr:ferritin family protein [Deltaproteobacteria bacterium]